MTHDRWYTGHPAMQVVLFVILLALLWLCGRASAQEVIIDNAAGTATGAWQESDGPNPYGGTKSLWTPNAGDTFAWPADIPEAGRYTLSAWWTVSGTRPSAAPYTIMQAGEAIAELTADQTANGGQWNDLGTMSLNAGHVDIILTDPPDGAACADAVRLVRAAAYASTVSVTWDANTEDDLAGYRVYCRTRNTLPKMEDVGNTTNATITGLEPGQEYIVYVTAYDTAGNESLPSIEIIAETPATPQDTTPPAPPTGIRATATTEEIGQ